MGNKMRALLLAAGLGTRLRPLTETWPKCLMPIGNRPLLEYWLEILWQNNIREVWVNVHYLPDIVRAFLKRPRFRGWVKILEESELLGTAGTLQTNVCFFQEGTTLLVHADNWCQCDFKAFINYHQKFRVADTVMTMMTFTTDTPDTCGIVKCDDRGVVRAFYEKTSDPPGFQANAAVYLIEPDVVDWIAKQPVIRDFSTQVLPQFLGRIATWHNSQVHRDIGMIDSFIQAQQDQQPDPFWEDDDDWQPFFIKHPIHQLIKETF